MDCRDSSQHLDAFANGRLDAELNREAFAHLSGCAACAAKIAKLREMKNALHRVFGSERVPAELVDRVRARVGALSAKSATLPTRFQKWVVPLGMAAAVVFVWQAGVWFDLSEVSPNGSHSASEARWIQAVRFQHQGCIKLGSKHHRAALPRGVKLIGAVLREELGLEVLAPDWTSLGYRLHSADTCGVNNIPGAHLVYERMSDGRLLSIFSVKRLEAFAPSSGFRAGGRGCFVCDCPGATILAWHENGVTYLFCGKMSVNELVRLADASR